jgi:hypothetical protein
MVKLNDWESFWSNDDGVSVRLENLCGAINTGFYNNALQVVAPIYGMQYFKMAGPQPKCEYCIKYYGRIYRQGMFMRVSCAPKLLSPVGCLVSIGKRIKVHSFLGFSKG